MRRSLPLILSLALLALALPSIAAAKVYCVDYKPCDPLGQEVNTIGDALTLAASNGTEDTVRIGGQAVPYQGPFSYTSSEPVHIIGSGKGGTVLTRSGFGPVLQVASGSSTVSNLTIQVPDTAGAYGFDAQCDASNIEILHSGTATDVRGVELQLNSQLTGLDIRMDGGIGVDYAADTPSSVRDSRISAPTGVRAGVDAELELSGLRIEASGIGVLTSGASSKVKLENSVVRTSSPGSVAIYAYLGSQFTGRHLTLSGQPGGAGVIAETATGQQSNVTIASSVISGFTQSLRREGTLAYAANLTVGNSSYDPSTFAQSGAGSFTDAGGNLLDVAPGFVDDGSYRLRADSPLIDRGSAGGILAEDVAGAPRPVDGDGDGFARPDIGATEFQPGAPSASIAAPASALPGAAAAFDGSASSDPDPGDALSYAWSFGDGGSASGPQASHAYGAPGTYEVTLTVTDRAGRVGTATHAVVVGAVSDGRDTAAPVISRLALTPSRFRIGSVLPALRASARRPHVAVSLSEASRVRLTFRRKRGARFVRVRGGRLALAVPAGASRIAFQGRISRRLRLRPGRYRVVAQATDAAGNRSARRRAGFTLLPRR